MEERLTFVKTILILRTAPTNISIQVLFMLIRLGPPPEITVQQYVIMLACLSIKEQSMTMLLPHLILTIQLMFVQLKDKLKEQLHLTKTVQLILRITLTLQQQLFQVTVQQHKQQLIQEVQKEQHVQDTPTFQLGVLQLYIILLENQLFTMDNCSNNLTTVQEVLLTLVSNGLLGFICVSTYLSYLILSQLLLDLRLVPLLYSQ